VALIRRRWVAAAGLVLAGAAAAVVFWPSPEQYTDRHRTRICAPPGRIAPAIKEVLSSEQRWDSGFVLVAETPGELVFQSPKAVMKFTIGAAPFGCKTLTVETRIQVIAAYWRLVQPAKSLLRRKWLDAVRRRAEAK
jgi:hypothetical protein